MYTNVYKLLLGFTLCGTLMSCFKDEPLNAECDIEQAYIHTDNPLDIFFSATDTLIDVASDKNDITFRIKPGADLTSLAPVLRITHGAVVEPESGSVHDFSNGKAVVYKVTSQDGQWSRSYTVSFRTYDPVSEFDFEHYTLVKPSGKGEYYAWSDLNPDGSEAGNWATGNPGFNLSMGNAGADEYPTVPVTDGYDGAAVKLETKDTGPLGKVANMRLAAGNLFIGTFDVQNALKDALRATRFGMPFDRKPLRITGWYKYRPGENMQDRQGDIIEGKTDRGDIYAVFYRNHDDSGNAIMLDGSDVKTHPCIVAIAQVDELLTTDKWTEFGADFIYSEEIDPVLLVGRGYSLAVVFTSSVEGASFCGAIGSTLYIDKVKVEWEQVYGK